MIIDNKDMRAGRVFRRSGIVQMGSADRDATKCVRFSLRLKHDLRHNSGLMDLGFLSSSMNLQQRRLQGPLDRRGDDFAMDKASARGMSLSQARLRSYATSANRNRSTIEKSSPILDWSIVGRKGCQSGSCDK